MDHGAADGLLYFLKYPLLILIYLFVLAALRIAWRSLDKIDISGRTAHREPEAPKVLGVQSGAVSAAKRAESESQIVSAVGGSGSSASLSGAEGVRRKRNTRDMETGRLESVSRNLSREDGRQDMKRGDSEGYTVPGGEQSRAAVHRTGAQSSVESSPDFVISEMPTASEIPAAGGRFYIEVLNSPEPMEKRIELEKELVFGRGKDCAVILNDKFVSSRHARIILGPLGPILEDLSSRNGTLCNERLLEAPEVLQDGDKFALGDYIFRCRREA
ncbi:FHA domain-containing protein [bacterium]|nr:FHA domain-containing protein [bacterium]